METQLQYAKKYSRDVAHVACIAYPILLESGLKITRDRLEKAIIIATDKLELEYYIGQSYDWYAFCRSVGKALLALQTACNPHSVLTDELANATYSMYKLQIHMIKLNSND